MAQVFTDFGPNEQDWDVDDTGRPGIGLVSNAIQVWSACQDGETTVQQASSAFNIDEGMVRRAVENHPWMFLDGDIIEHDGE